MALIDLRRPFPQGRGPWALSRVAYQAFMDQPQTRRQWPIARSVTLRFMLIVSILTSEIRVHPSGRALCLLTLASPRRNALAMLMIGAGLGALSAMVLYSPITFWLVVVLALILLVPSLSLSFSARHANATLRKASPRTSFVGVHTVASVQPGAGRELMLELNREADERGWTLVLDAANDALAGYYAGLGYEPRCEPVPMPWGERAVRMMRVPAGNPGAPA